MNASRLKEFTQLTERNRYATSALLSRMNTSMLLIRDTL